MPDRSPRKRLKLVALGLALAGLATTRSAGAGLLDDVPKLVNFKLDDPAAAHLKLLESFREASVERPGPVKTYLSSRWGEWGHEPWWKLAWGASSSAPAQAAEAASAPLVSSESQLFGFETPPSTGGALRLQPNAAPSWLARLNPDWMPPALESTGATFASNGFDALWSMPPIKPIPNWRCRRRPVRFVRYAGESDAFALVHCDGAVAPEALDRLTIMARLPEAARPGELLPDEPDPESIAKGEWAPGVRVVNPRLLWALQRIADAFPWRNVYVFSGYRQRKPNEKPGSHHSLHSDARAMDINIMGIPNAALFQFCRTLEDVGCGFYPNSKFVHVDVRRPGTGHASWIDISGPGEPSHYVDAWPGVVDKGGLAWDPRGAASQSHSSSEASCTPRP